MWISLNIFHGYEWICMDMFGYPYGYLIQYNKLDMFPRRPIYIHRYPYISVWSKFPDESYTMHGPDDVLSALATFHCHRIRLGGSGWSWHHRHLDGANDFLLYASRHRISVPNGRLTVIGAPGCRKYRRTMLGLYRFKKRYWPWRRSVRTCTCVGQLICFSFHHNGGVQNNVSVICNDIFDGARIGEKEQCSLWRSSQ